MSPLKFSGIVTFQLFMLALSPNILPGEAVCYFPADYQGEYLMQESTIASNEPATLSSLNLKFRQVVYGKVNITPDGIQAWGSCYKRIGDNVILINGFNRTLCIRCIHISLKSGNVVVASTALGLNKCFSNLQIAESNCPTKLHFQDPAKSIILYKSKEYIQREYCPFNGKFKLEYKQTDESVCANFVSGLDNCPIGSEINLRFRSCPFENHDIIFECMASWRGVHNESFLTLFDTKADELKYRPKYRCALYKEDVTTGNVYVAFSSDSTCVTDLENSKNGFETLILKIQPTRPWPRQLEQHNCVFPSWLQGRWEHVTVDGKLFTYKDNIYFKTYSMQCVNFYDGKSSFGHDFTDTIDDKRFLVYAKTQCGEEMFSCLWAKKRSVNVFEFQIGMLNSYRYNDSICSDLYFQPKVWITQGRIDRFQESECPIIGEFAGNIPDADGMCAKISSDCTYPEVMYYTVTDCAHNQVYEGGGYYRKYRKTRQVNDIAAKGSLQKNSIGENVQEGNGDSDIWIQSEVTSEPGITTPTTATTSSFIETQMPPHINYLRESTATISSLASPLILTTSVVESASTRGKTGQLVTAMEFTTGVLPRRNNLNDTNYELSAVPSSTSINQRFFDQWQLSRMRQGPSHAETLRNPSILTTMYRHFTPYPLLFSSVPSYNNYNSYNATESESRTLRNSGDNYENVSRQRGREFLNWGNVGWNNSYFWDSQKSRSEGVFVADPVTGTLRRTAIALPPIQLHYTTINPFYHRSVQRPQQNGHEVKVEERQYRCLGQWKEGGLTYAFTERKDMKTFECFVGMSTSNEEIYIKEAGPHCQRNIDPRTLGMLLTKKGSCLNNQTINTSNNANPIPVLSLAASTTKRPVSQQTTKNWRPITISKIAPRNRNVTINFGMESASRRTLLVYFLVIILVIAQ